jgi:hypothetical protein
VPEAFWLPVFDHGINLLLTFELNKFLLRGGIIQRSFWRGILQCTLPSGRR